MFADEIFSKSLKIFSEWDSGGAKFFFYALFI
jgi:hypothetical protein